MSTTTLQEPQWVPLAERMTQSNVYARDSPEVWDKVLSRSGRATSNWVRTPKDQRGNFFTRFAVRPHLYSLSELTIVRSFKVSLHPKSTWRSPTSIEARRLDKAVGGNTASSCRLACCPFGFKASPIGPSLVRPLLLLSAVIETAQTPNGPHTPLGRSTSSASSSSFSFTSSELVDHSRRHALIICSRLHYYCALYGTFDEKVRGRDIPSDRTVSKLVSPLLSYCSVLTFSQVKTTFFGLSANCCTRGLCSPSGRLYPAHFWHFHPSV